MKLNAALKDLLYVVDNQGIAPRHLADRKRSEFKISDGTIALDGDLFQDDDWIVIVDDTQRLNGIYLLAPPTDPEEGLFLLLEESGGESPVKGEKTFTGTVYLLALPKRFVELAREYQAEQNEPGANAGVVSHSVAGFYKETVATNERGQPLSWFERNADKLPPFAMWNEVVL